MRIERRTNVRIPLDAGVAVAVKSETGFFLGLAEDLCEHGLFVTTRRALPIGGEVALALSLPRGEVVARGRVRWKRGGASGEGAGVGIEFDALPPEDRARVEEYCDEGRRAAGGRAT